MDYYQYCYVIFGYTHIHKDIIIVRKLLSLTNIHLKHVLKGSINLTIYLKMVSSTRFNYCFTHLEECGLNFTQKLKTLIINN